MAPDPCEGDVLFGCQAIGRHLGLSERQTRHLVEKGSLPTFRFPGSAIICARRTGLDQFLEQRERAAMADRES